VGIFCYNKLKKIGIVMKKVDELIFNLKIAPIALKE
jgi:hypothetical protein